MGFFRYTAGAAKFFDHLSTSYLGIFSKILPLHPFLMGACPSINSEILGQSPKQESLKSVSAPKSNSGFARVEGIVL